MASLDAEPIANLLVLWKVSIQGRIQNFFAEGGGGGGGALIIMVWAWLRNIARKRGVWGFAPAAFLLLSCYFGAFSLYLYHQRDIRHRPL